MSAHSDAIDIIFTDPNLAEDAIWRPGGAGAGIPVRIIRKLPDEIVGFGSSRAVLPSGIVAVRGSDVASPASGDTVEIGMVVFDVIAQPRRDSLGFIWECEASARG